MTPLLFCAFLCVCFHMAPFTPTLKLSTNPTAQHKIDDELSILNSPSTIELSVDLLKLKVAKKSGGVC